MLRAVASGIPGSTAITQPAYDNSTLVATDAFVQAVSQLSMSTTPLNLGATGGGTYSFASLGSGASGTFVAAGGVITSLTGVVSAGTGYAVGDLITIASGNHDAVIRVATLSGSGVATATILYGGTGYSSGTGTAIDSISSVPFTFTLTGTLTSNATFVMTNGTLLTQSNQWVVNNNTTGAFTTTFKISNGSDTAIGTGVVIPQGSNNSAATFIETDGVTDVWLAANPVGQISNPNITGRITVADLTTIGASISTTLLLDFANGKSVDPRITFTRASGGTYTDAFGVLQLAASNILRFDYNPVTGLCRGALIEPASTNLLTYSEEFSNTGWITGGATISPNAITAPDGTLTADRLVESATAFLHYVNQSKSVTNSNPVTGSVVAKAGERTSIVLYIQENTTLARKSFVAFDLSAGTVGSITEISGATGSSATIVSVGNGLYRCSLTTTIGGADPGVILYIVIGTNLGNYPGDITKGLYIWGAQLEEGPLTSYIKTGAASASRAADVATMSGTNFSNWYNQAEGTFVVASDSNLPVGPDASLNAIVASDGTVANRVRLGYSCSSSVLSVFGFVQTSSVTQCDLSGSDAFIPGVKNLYSFAYKVNDFVGVKNGGTLRTDTSGTIPTVSQLNIGSSPLGDQQLNGHIEKILYFPRRLTNAELQSESLI